MNFSDDFTRPSPQDRGGYTVYSVSSLFADPEVYAARAEVAYQDAVDAEIEMTMCSNRHEYFAYHLAQLFARGRRRLNLALNDFVSVHLEYEEAMRLQNPAQIDEQHITDQLLTDFDQSKD